MSKVKEFKKHLLSRGGYYPILYPYVEINQELAEKIVEILCGKRCSVEESIHFIDATFSMMRESRFSPNASVRTTRAQCLSLGNPVTQIVQLLLSARVNFYEVVGTLEYAKHLVHSSVLVEE